MANKPKDSREKVFKGTTMEVYAPQVQARHVSNRAPRARGASDEGTSARSEGLWSNTIRSKTGR